ncbi:hypothetical protein GPB2148_258 [marine gamma proteobacterium HTCC2148]|jgi:phenylacetate-coenzyme A ligase PaaK-like adenylate-forming protein|nr:hypothetical protein GPB2148_258 [marine gamma proteobacterium HTCC2148]MBT3409700.1 phenylacetate--CoA ligase family protein [Halieaceae bacterium]
MEIPTPKAFERRPYAQEQFKAITAWAKDNHPFYRKWLQNCEESVPLLSRVDILENNDQLLDGHAVTATTSGSTGVPVKTAWSKDRMALEGEVTNRFISWLGGRLGVTRFIHTDNPEEDCRDVKTPVAEQLAFIKQRFTQHQATAITTYPSNAERLCHAVFEQGLDMHFVQRFGVFAEVFEPYQEALIKQAFPNAQIWSTYSAQEVGMIAGRCPHHPKYHHVLAGKLGVEILNDDNEPCAQGEVGRVVITDFFNTAMPLIRYDIGDLAAWGECPCGKIDFPAFSTILGKIRGSLLHRNGERVPFTELSVALRNIEGMRQYQVIQDDVEHFTVRLVHLANELTNSLQQQVEEAFQQHFSYLPKLTVIMENEIERENNGKFYSSKCTV